MVSGSLALLYFLLSFHGGRQGSGPDRGQSPVEWGDFPSVRSFVCLFVRPSVRPFPPWAIQAWLAGPQAWLAWPQAGLAGLEGGDRWMNGHTSGHTNRWTENSSILHKTKIKKSQSSF